MENPPKRKQVLIVDSEPAFVKTMAHTLEGHNYDALTAISSKGAMHKAESLDIDLVLLGEGISDASPLEVCRQLKMNPNTEYIPLVFMARTEEKSYRIKAYQSGADDYVAKDCDSEELFVRMEAVWRRGNGVFKRRQEERQKKIVDELVRVIENGLVEPHFQPIYYLKPFHLLGLEVLSRPARGSFLANAEELFRTALKYDMYYPLEMLCWSKAVEIVASATRNEHMFFNCAPSIVENDKAANVRSIFEAYKIPFNKVVLELTERSSVSEYKVFNNRLSEYRHYGFSFAVDDVGSGYASLESVVATRPEIVKIDSHIIRDVHLDPVKRSIVKFIVAFCRENSIISVAEGVETKEEMDSVKELGVDSVQGYYLYRPTASLNLREIKDLCVAFA